MDRINNSKLLDHSARRAQENETGGEAGLLDHLTELRSRLIKALASVIPGFAVAYGLAGPIIDFLVRPLKAALPEGPGLIATGLPDTFFVHLKIGLWAGLFFSSPYWLYQLWAFVAPGLYRQERRATLRLAAFSFLLLIGGAAFAYFLVLPLAFQFFAGFSTDDISLLPTIRQYLSLVTAMLMAFGLAFQLPLGLLFLNGLGLVDADKLGRFRRYAVVLIVILAAILTPPDVISQIFLAVPLIGLYEISILMIRNREAREPKSADKPEETSE